MTNNPLTISGKLTDSDLVITVQATADAGGDNSDVKIVLSLPAAILDPALKTAVEGGTDVDLNESPIVGLEPKAGWNVRGKAISDDVIEVSIKNDTSPPKGSLKSGESRTLKVRLAAGPPPAEIDVNYRFMFKSPNADIDKFQDILRPRYERITFVPVVVLRTPQTSPTAIEPRAEVTVKWEVENGVSAVLKGPLPGGYNLRTLDEDTPNSGKFTGEFTVLAVGSMTFLLEAEVKNPNDASSPNFRIVRMLALDVLDPGQYACLDAFPKYALRNSLVHINYAVWGVKTATLGFGDISSTDLELTQHHEGYYHAFGKWLVRVPADFMGDHIVASMQIQFDSTKRSVSPDDYNVNIRSWEKGDVRLDQDKGIPVGLAYSNGYLVLVTKKDGRSKLWLDKVGAKDSPNLSNKPEFKTEVQLPYGGDGEWLALTPLAGGLAALRLRTDGEVELLRFTIDAGKIKPQADGQLTLPAQFRIADNEKSEPRRHDLAAVGNRVYIIFEKPDPKPQDSRKRQRSRRLCCSRDFARTANEWQQSPSFDPFEGYRPFATGSGLYALHAESLDLVRFDAEGEGQGWRLVAKATSHPVKAVSTDHVVETVSTDCLPVGVGEVIVLIGAAVPATDAESARVERPATRALIPPVDLVYDPQQDRWDDCGRDPKLAHPRFAAFRPGASPRMWVVGNETQSAGGAQPERWYAYTLSDPTEALFIPEYYSRWGKEKKVLPPYFDKTLEATLKNDLPTALHLLDESLSGGFGYELAEFPKVLPSGQSINLKFRYNGARTPTHVSHWVLDQAATVPGDFRATVTLSLDQSAGLKSWESIVNAEIAAPWVKETVGKLSGNGPGPARVGITAVSGEKDYTDKYRLWFWADLLGAHAAGLAPDFPAVLKEQFAIQRIERQDIPLGVGYRGSYDFSFPMSVPIFEWQAKGTEWLMRLSFGPWYDREPAARVSPQIIGFDKPEHWFRQLFIEIPPGHRLFYRAPDVNNVYVDTGIRGETGFRNYVLVITTTWMDGENWKDRYLTNLTRPW